MSTSVLVFAKLGGSLLTDKTRPATPQLDTLRRLAGEIAGALAAAPGLRLLLSHGSGSFGHVAGQRYRTRDGVRDAAGWRGFAKTAAAAARLNRLVVDALLGAGVPVWSLQPSASARCHDGRLVQLAWQPVRDALAHGLVPLVYGDVALDDVRGGTIISTEEILAFLAPHLHPRRIVLVGVVDGVYAADPLKHPGAARLSVIHPADVARLGEALGGSHGMDVTGGMLSKIRGMAALVAQQPGLEVRLTSGAVPGKLAAALAADDWDDGTVLRG